MRISRRDAIKLGLMAGSATLIGGRRTFGQQCTGFVDQTPTDIMNVSDTGCQALDKMPMSPFILNPFSQPLPILQSLLPGYRQPDGTLVTGTETISRSIANAPNAWPVRIKNGATLSAPAVSRPGPGVGDQDALGDRPRVSVDPVTGTSYTLPDAGTHQLWTDGSGVSGSQVAGVLNPWTGKAWFPMPEPLLYHIRLQLRQASFTNSPVVNLDSNGNFVQMPQTVSGFTPVGSATDQSGHTADTYQLPASTIYGFNGTFPGPMINLVYGRPVIVRFENDLDHNPLCLDRQDFGAPDWAFLTHQHNGHTAPESDGQPHHMTDHEGGYQPGEWVDNLYMGYPAGGDPLEMQSFLWFHDHRMHHTGANVYKGMVGLTPWYNPWDDYGDETDTKNTRNLHLPGRRSFDSADPTGSTFNVKYDIPLAFYDVALDDGVIPHADLHTPLSQCGLSHPEWWGKTFFRHYPDQGFTGDIFTVNGVAYPVLHVSQRHYRFRFLDCSVSRIYRFWLMSSVKGPVAAPGTQGQWLLPDGVQSMQWDQIACDGGLLPNYINRSSFELWPAKRREFFVDFTKYMNGHKTSKGDVIWLVNDCFMPDGRKPNSGFQGDSVNKNYLVPMIKFVIDGPPPTSEGKDMSTCPNKLRAMPAMLGTPSTLPNRTFILSHGGGLGSEAQWLINNLQFDPLNPLALPKRAHPEVWTTQNGGGGWVHPMHMHYEEHHVLSRNGVPSPDALHPDDTGREDLTALYPSESVTFYRNFRTFAGKYVAHCHNLAHEDHNMMFGWTVIP